MSDEALREHIARMRAAGLEFREGRDGQLIRTYPHNGLARIELTRETLGLLLRAERSYWTERKIRRALDHPWRFRSEINFLLRELLVKKVEEVTLR